MEPKRAREPFCLEWKIGNLGHWSSEVHGDLLKTTVDFGRGRLFDFRVYLNRNDKGRTIIVFPEELSHNRAQLVVKGSDDGSVLCAIEKSRSMKIFEIWNFREKVGDNFVLFITVMNACKNSRYEYASTVFHPVPLASSQSDRNPVVQRRNGCLTFRQKLDRLYSSREPQSSVRQPIPSLESLCIGKESSHQPSGNDPFWTIQLSMGRDSDSLSARQMRRYSFSPRQPPTELPNADASSHPTPEQLVLGLGSLSISREVEASPSDQSASTDIASSKVETGGKFPMESPLDRTSSQVTSRPPFESLVTFSTVTTDFFRRLFEPTFLDDLDGTSSQVTPGPTFSDDFFKSPSTLSTAIPSETSSITRLDRSSLNHCSQSSGMSRYCPYFRP